MTKPDALTPVHLPYLQMIRLLPPRRPIGEPCPPSCEGGMCGCDEDGDDAPPTRGGTHCDC
jgi:hypothetical protein